jgi:hypothetical protein
MKIFRLKRKRGQNMPNRILKESICTSEELANISSGAETLFYRLIVKADDYGCFFADPEIVRNACFTKKKTVKEKDVIKWLQELHENKLIKIYAHNNKQYLYLITFGDHQKRRAINPKFPLPTDANICEQMHTNAPVFVFDNVFVNDNVNDILQSGEPTEKPNSKHYLIQKEKYGEFQHVLMTTAEYEKLNTVYGKKAVESKIAYLDASIQSKIKKYMAFKDHYATIGNWLRADAEKPQQQSRASPQKNNAESLKYNQRDYKDGDLDYLYANLEDTT